jgi:arylsulfatase A-like enzyme
MYDPETIALPLSFNSGERPIPPHLQKLYEERELNKSNRNGQRTFAISEREAREATALTYGMITMIDDAIGKILARLVALGLESNTVIMFTTDHGDFMGDHQLLLKGALHYRGLVRVPFIWHDHAATKKNIINSGLCGTLDIASTVLDRAGLAGYNGMQGRSLLSAVKGDATGYDSLIIEEHQRRGYMGLENNFRARSLITDNPDESNNLWDVSHAAKYRNDLTERLARKMMQLAETSPLAKHHGP